MNNCPHHFEPRYDTITKDIERTEYKTFVFDNDTVETEPQKKTIEKYKDCTIYLFDICVHCGLKINREENK